MEKNRKKKNWKNLLLYGLLVIISGTAVFKLTPSAPESVQATERIIYEEKSFQFNNPYPGVKSIYVSSYSQEPTDWKTDVKIETDSGVLVKQYSGWLENAYLFDAIFSGYPQLFIVREEGHQILTSILFYDREIKNVVDFKFIDKDKSESVDMCCSYVIFRPWQNGVQYDLAVRSLEQEFVYEYDFLKPVFIDR